MDKHIFYEGQEVGCLMYGEGVICEIGQIVKVDFKEWKTTYLINGAFDVECRPTLYPIEQYRAIIANLPAPQPEAWQPKPGEWCWFWDNKYRCALLSMLERYHADSTCAFETVVGSRYKYCAPFTGELPEHLKEVQP